MAFKRVKQYKISIAVASTAAIQLAAIATVRALGVQPQIRAVARDADAVMIFGGSGVTAASATATANALPDGNIYQPAGVVEVYDMRPDEDYVRLLSADGATTGTLWITVGYNEKS